MMSSYRLLTRFVVTAWPAQVFEAALEPELWLPDLDHLRRLELIRDEGSDPIGRVYEAEVVTAGYRLRWRMAPVEVVPHVLLAWEATGDLTGRGSWTLSAASVGTLVTSRWEVRTTRPWMRVLAPVARPLFVRNHDRVMRAGAQLLADHLGAELVSFSSTEESHHPHTGWGDPGEADQGPVVGG